jgi:uncharacterized protein (TIGR02266 family)
MSNDSRSEPRFPISLEVSYRTASAFLVSYSVNLSKGGIFIETDTPLPHGEKLSLHFEVPTVGTLAVEGIVAWSRTVKEAGEQNMPPGIGIRFDALDVQYGEKIDALVRDFVGLTVLVVAGSADRLSLLGRYVRSVISCEILEAGTPEVAEVSLEQQAPDLVVVDLDAGRELGFAAVRAAKRGNASVPVILLAGSAEARAEGRTHGADHSLSTPPSHTELRTAIIRCLSRPELIR